MLWPLPSPPASASSVPWFYHGSLNHSLKGQERGRESFLLTNSSQRAVLQTCNTYRWIRLNWGVNPRSGVKSKDLRWNTSTYVTGLKSHLWNPSPPPRMSDQLTSRPPAVSYLTIHRRRKEQRLSLLVQVSIFGNGDAEACNRTSMVRNHLKQQLEQVYWRSSSVITYKLG